MKSRPSIVQVVRGFATEFSTARLKVSVAYKKSGGQWTHRRLGFGFDKEATTLELCQLGSDPVQVASSLVTLVTDTQADTGVATLNVILAVPDLTERTIGEADVAELRAFIAARGVVAE